MIQSWATVMSMEQFFKGVEERAIALPEVQRGRLLERLQLAREFIGTQVSCPEVWLVQCLCESNESLPYRKLVESAKAEEQRIRIGTFQSASIDGKNLNTLGRRQLFSSS